MRPMPLEDLDHRPLLH
jgi:hypothetical protein